MGNSPVTTSRKAKPAPRHSHAARQVRIIGGQWKRTPLAVLDAEGLRPTPDRVRETVFNWINHLFDGNWAAVRCLDLFAGTGALGFEAASRGAAEVLMLESDAAAIRQLDATREKLKATQVTVRRGDALAAAQSLVRQGARFQLIFLDPPYRQEWLVKILPLCRQLLADGGLVYAEAETPLNAAFDDDNPPEWLAGWTVVRADKAGMVFYHLLQRKSMSEIQA
ncbi:16S rRNA (guanine(966)-N(2))-methyltransferase RsmD [Noviherbaspirillum saxi]|uniref:16S rRNA (Guanine(966)-N(2))-methyltransferase RsmD n=1 Tax=Noviherbaspirillum saxi TaxID=2320863 RepID=A0A3A3G9T8_9BURK|nr:16S rRNA (guanine(966)-N(2))-methyltransferase RsmD [Noviherbaspirillum saxi]RJF97639.1 16S rRNA (guanine(966)-N(2))-methyltransferase RsmD [Noviherbaspirillum saxi]